MKISIITKVKTAGTVKEVKEFLAEGLDYPYISKNTRNKLVKVSMKQMKDLKS